MTPTQQLQLQRDMKRGMARAMRTTWRDTRSVMQAANNGLRPCYCPACASVLVRDFSASKLTYACAGCARRWMAAS